MNSIALFHNGSLILRQRIRSPELSIGTSPGNDIVLAGGGVRDDRMVISRGPDGLWRAMIGEGGDPAVVEDLEEGTVFSIGPYSVELAGMEDGDAGHGAAPGPGEVRGDPREAVHGMVGDSAQLGLLRAQISRVAPLRAPVLVTGETGTGKELVARALHLASGRPVERFVAVNCGGLARTMFEDILFGHERGAFTGAASTHRGVFERASGGTLFLDEIGELPMEQQASLLRVLDTGVVSRLGSEREERVAFRLVSATNRSLKSMVATGTFRMDLYHRLCAVSLATPPLRDRPGDLEPMARRFLEDIAADLGPRELGADALGALVEHSWPGNARELRNVLYQAALACSGRTIRARHLRMERPDAPTKRVPFRLSRLEDDRIGEALSDHDGNIAAAARALGVPRTSLRDRVRRMGTAA